MLLTIVLILLAIISIMTIIAMTVELFGGYSYDPEEEYRAFMKKMYGTQSKKPPMRTIHAVEIDEPKERSDKNG